MRLAFSIVCSVLLAVVCISPAWSLPGTTPVLADKPLLNRHFQQAPLSFETNRGQTDGRVEFLARGPGYIMFLTADGLVMRLNKPGASWNDSSGSAVVRMSLAGANTAPIVTGLEELPGRVHYLTGGRANWRTGIPTYGKVRYEEVYPGIDLVCYGNQRRLEYDLVVRPGADPGRIRLAYSGLTGKHLDESGNLILETNGGRLVQQVPTVYQETDGRRTPVAGRYELLEGGQVGFRVAGYNPDRPLVIDPLLTYSTYLGGSDGNDYSYAGIFADASGNVWVAGTTASSDFPTVSPFQGASGGSNETFVTKFNPSGQPVYSTYIGGGGADNCWGLDVDSSGYAYVTGDTNTPPATFPITSGAFQTSKLGTVDAFAAKLSVDGSSLVYCTYLGGTGNDYGTDVAVDSDGNAYLTGGTASLDFPTVNANQTVHGTDSGGYDAYFTKLNAAGTALLYSTYLGGDGSDYNQINTPPRIAVCAGGRAHITGSTRSSTATFPVKNAYQTSHSDTAYDDAFLTVFDPSLSGASSLVYSTFLGVGGNPEYGRAIATDSSGMSYVMGQVSVTGFPLVNEYQTYQGGTDCFISKFNPYASGAGSLLYSTYLGGSGGSDYPRGIAVNDSGEAFVVGETNDAASFPSYDALGPGGAGDLFVSQLGPDGDTLPFSVIVGGASSEMGRGIALDPDGNIYVTAETYSSDFPTARPYQASLSGTMDVAVFRIDELAPWIDSNTPDDGATDVALDTTVTATFNELMDVDSITSDYFYLTPETAADRATIPATVVFDADTLKAILTPAANLEPGATYTATVDFEVNDLAGYNIGDSYSWSFTTTTEPAEASTSYDLTFPAGSTVADYRMAAIPLKPLNSRPTAVFGSQIGTYDTSLMRIGHWDSQAQRYYEYPFKAGYRHAPGDTGWFLFRNGKTLTVEGEPTPTEIGPMSLEGYGYRLEQGWNQVGNPYQFAISVDTFVVEEEDESHEYLTGTGNTITQKVFWVWSNGAYRAASTLGVAQGGWLKKLTPGSGRIFFPLNQQVLDSEGNFREVADDEERPPDPPTGLSVSVQTEGGGGGCFIGQSGR